MSKSMHVTLSAVAALALCLGAVEAAVDAVTDEGDRVRLYDDYTWEHIEAGEDETEPQITLSVVNKTDKRGSCVIGLLLKNDAPYRIVSLVPQFAAYVADDVPFDNVFVSFQSVKPTLDQFQELRFKQITCDEISRIEVHGGDRCNMEELNKYSATKGECLRRVRVVPSELVDISK